MGGEGIKKKNYKKKKSLFLTSPRYQSLDLARNRKDRLLVHRDHPVVDILGVKGLIFPTRVAKTPSCGWAVAQVAGASLRFGKPKRVLNS